MELAYFLPSLDKLPLFPLRHLSLENLHRSVLHEYFDRTPSVESATWFEDHLSYLDPTLRFSRLYFGNEFCEALIPTVAEFEEIAEVCRQGELRLTLVTPMVTGEGIHKIQKLLRAIQTNKMIIELVINDFGVLALCAGNSTVRPVLGRGLLKQTQFTRLEGVPTNGKGLSVRSWAGRHPLSSAPFLAQLAQKYGVQRVEFDLSRQGVLLPETATAIPTSVYFPWVVLNTQRLCPIGHSHLPTTDPIPAQPNCEFQCRSYSEVMEVTSEKGSQLLFQKGTTLFELVKPDTEVFTQLATTVNMDRIVYQPTLPF